MREVRITSASEACSLQIGRNVGECLQPGDVVALWGDLGAGKTLFTRGIARGLGIPEQTPITSPTFTFMNEYEGRLHLYHIDLYRLTDPDELETLPWREALYGNGVAAVEWPERLGKALPENRWDVELEITGDKCRNIALRAYGENNCRRLKDWENQWLPHYRRTILPPSPEPAI